MDSYVTRVTEQMERTLDYVERVCPRMRWARSDCLTITAGIILRAGGPDIAARYRGRYHDQASMHRMIPHGLAEECRRVAREVGAKRVKPDEAAPGAWGVYRNAGGLVVNVVKYRGDYWLGFADRGVDFIKSDRVRFAWEFC